MFDFLNVFDLASSTTSILEFRLIRLSVFQFLEAKLLCLNYFLLYTIPLDTVVVYIQSFVCVHVYDLPRPYPLYFTVFEKVIFDNLMSKISVLITTQLP